MSEETLPLSSRWNTEQVTVKRCIAPTRPHDDIMQANTVERKKYYSYITIPIDESN